MWMDCENNSRTDQGRLGLEESWPREETLRHLVDLNEQCLELLTEQVTMRGPSPYPILRELTGLWSTLDSNSRSRAAAACPYLLIDAGFADLARWRWVSGIHVGEREPCAFASFFSGPRLGAISNQIFMYAWHLARTEPITARVVLGMPPHCASLIGACSLRQITEVAERRTAWLRPRWATSVPVWRAFLMTAISGDAAALERERMYGLQLLAADLRASAQVEEETK